MTLNNPSNPHDLPKDQVQREVEPPLAKATVVQTFPHDRDSKTKRGFHTVRIRVYGEDATVQAPVITPMKGDANLPEVGDNVVVAYGSNEKPWVIGHWYAADADQDKEDEPPNHNAGDRVIGNGTNSYIKIGRDGDVKVIENGVELSLGGSGGSFNVSEDGNLVLGSPTDLNFTGSGVQVSDDGDGTVTLTITDNNTDTDTRTDVSDGGVTTVAEVTDINFGTDLDVTDDGDGTVTVDSSASGGSGGSFDVSDDGSLVLSDPTDLNFGTNVSVTDDGDGTVTITSTDTDTRVNIRDSDSLVLNDALDINFSNNLTVTDDGDNTVTVDADTGSSGGTTQEFFSSYQDATQNDAENGIYVNVFELIDVNDSAFTKDSSTQLTVNENGKYKISYSVNFHRTGTNGTNVMYSELEFNGTPMDRTRGVAYMRNAGTGDEADAQNEIITSLSSGDTIQLAAGEERGGETGNDIERANINVEYLG